MNNFRRILSISALAIVATGLGCADTIQYSHTTATSTTPFSDKFTLTSFDTNLGALTGITITLATTETAEVDIFNSTGVGQEFTNAQAIVPLSVAGPNAITVTSTGLAGPFAGAAAPGSNSFPGVTGSATNSGAVTFADFGLYEAPTVNNISLTLTGNNGNYSGAAASGVFFGGSASAGAVTTITYNYTPNTTTTTPEPATFAMFGGALVGLGLLRRKSK